MARKKKTEEDDALFLEYPDGDTALAALQDYFDRGADGNKQYYGEVDMALSIKVPLKTLREWRAGEHGEDFQYAAEWAYMKLAAMLETSLKYNEDKVAARKAAMLMQQPCFQGYSSKGDTSKASKMKIEVSFGDGMDASDLE